MRTGAMGKIGVKRLMGVGVAHVLDQVDHGLGGERRCASLRMDQSIPAEEYVWWCGVPAGQRLIAYRGTGIGGR